MGGDIPRSPLDVLPLGQHFRRSARASKPSWRPNPCQVRVCFGLQVQPALKRTSRSYAKSDLGALSMRSKDNFKMFPMAPVSGTNSSGVDRNLRGSWHPDSVPALWRRISVFGPCIMLEPIRGASRGSCTRVFNLYTLKKVPLVLHAPKMFSRTCIPCHQSFFYPCTLLDGVGCNSGKRSCKRKFLPLSCWIKKWICQGGRLAPMGTGQGGRCAWERLGGGASVRGDSILFYIFQT